MKKADSAQLLKTKGFVYIFLSKMPLVNYFIALIINVKKINEILFQIVFHYFFILVLPSYFSIFSPFTSKLLCGNSIYNVTIKHLVEVFN